MLFYDCDMADLIVLISDMIMQLIHHNDRLPLTPSGLTRFHSRAPPAISVHDYLSRIVRYTSLEKVCLLSTVVYIDRLCTAFRTFVVSSLTIHRFLITATTVATKGLCDAFCTNTHYARVGGISLSELNVLELELLAKLNWRILSPEEELQSYYVNMCVNNSRYVLPAGVAESVVADVVDAAPIRQSEMSPQLAAAARGDAALVEARRKRRGSSDRQSDSRRRRSHSAAAANNNDNNAGVDQDTAMREEGDDVGEDECSESSASSSMADDRQENHVSHPANDIAAGAGDDDDDDDDDYERIETTDVYPQQRHDASHRGIVAYDRVQQQQRQQHTQAPLAPYTPSLPHR